MKGFLVAVLATVVCFVAPGYAYSEFHWDQRGGINPNRGYVNPYQRSDGTNVSGGWRTPADGNPYNNLTPPRNQPGGRYDYRPPRGY